MRRLLILLALFVAGLGPSAPFLETTSPLEHQPVATFAGVEAAASVEAAAALRAVAPPGAGVWLDGSTASPRGVPRRSRPAATRDDDFVASAHAAASRARRSDSSAYLSRDALARAGRLSFPTHAPPPFRFV